MTYFTPGARLFNSSERKHVLKRAERHCCEVNTLWTFACNSIMFFKVSQRGHFRKSLTESERSDRF